MSRIEAAEAAALKVLRSNIGDGAGGLPRTAGFGYPEPYTRDLMISSLGILSSADQFLAAALRRVLTSLAENQSRLGHIPSLADSPYDRGESDTTPLFLFGLAAFRRATGEDAFLDSAAKKALTWLEYQSPADRVIAAQQPTSDWRDEQWVQGYGIYVNSLLYAALKLWGHEERAKRLHLEMNRDVVSRSTMLPDETEGLSVPGKPYYALWSYKIHSSDRFDLLGNSLAVLTGIAERSRAEALVEWVEETCGSMRDIGTLAVNLPPNFFPFILESDPDWRERYATYNCPGTYHNGGVWPFVCGFYVAALVALEKHEAAEAALEQLTDLVALSTRASLEFGFNEWISATDGTPRGVDWQTWSAAMYLYAADCVRYRRTAVFDLVRGDAW